MTTKKTRSSRRVGLIVFIILIGLLIAEFLVAGISVPPAVIIFFGALQALIVLWEYMHLSRFLTDSPPEDGPEA